MGITLPKTYRSWINGEINSIQNEYKEQTELLSTDGTLLSPGWARHMVFELDRARIKPRRRFYKEWEFYQISNGRFTVQVNIAKIAVGGFVSAVLTDLRNPSNGVIVNATAFFFGNDTVSLPLNGEGESRTEYSVKGIGSADFKFITTQTERTLFFRSFVKGKEIVCNFNMDIPENHENMTTVLPFYDNPTAFFLTMKQNCMPCEGKLSWGDTQCSFSKTDSFCCLDWGRVNAPRHVVWYWGNGSSHITDENGKPHTFGFEITWGIGDESFATETCLFYDGKVHKIGAVDVEQFPKPDKYMNPWHIISEDGRFDMTMTPFFDQHSDTNALILRMNCHQVHGTWNGTAVLDDGTVLHISDMYAFCEYVENKW